jgi:hypothetical protein
MDTDASLLSLTPTLIGNGGRRKRALVAPELLGSVNDETDTFATDRQLHMNTQLTLTPHEVEAFALEEQYSPWMLSLIPPHK